MNDDIEMTYTVRVDGGRTVEMTGMQEDLHKILVAMRAVRSEPAPFLTGIDYVLGTEEHKAVASLDLLNFLHPDTAGLVMCQAITKAWPDAGQDRLDLLNLATEYMSGLDDSSRRTFLIGFKEHRSLYSDYIWHALMRATESK